MKNIASFCLLLCFIFTIRHSNGEENNKTQNFLQSEKESCDSEMIKICRNGGGMCEKMFGIDYCLCRNIRMMFDMTLLKCTYPCDAGFKQYCLNISETCEKIDGKNQCTCKENKTFDNVLKKCIVPCDESDAEYCKDRGALGCTRENEKRKCIRKDGEYDKEIDRHIVIGDNCTRKCRNGRNCTISEGKEICKCPIHFWGESCENVNLCKIHHQDGLSGEEYCERGDAKCIKDERLNCRCYNPHRYFDYQSGMCINPCTEWPCRNGGTCIFNETSSNSTCLCNSYFTGNRCEDVNWCRTKQIYGKSMEEYCYLNGANCEITESKKIECQCESRDSEFDYSLNKCIEIDMCARNRRGYQICSERNALCKNDRSTKSRKKYICECPPGRKMLDNGICEERNVCDKGEKGHEICSLLRAECLLNNSITNRFECRCPPDYAPNDHGRCIEIKICQEGHQGFIDCNNRNAVCLRNYDNEKGYQCECKTGYKKSEVGRCNAINECDEGEVGFLECHLKNAVCVRDISRYKKYVCVCPENYFMEINGKCQKIYRDSLKIFGSDVNTLNDLCQKGNKGYEKCLKQKAICIISPEDNSFSCHCRSNQRRNSKGICMELDICENGQLGYKECSLLSSQCIKVSHSEKGYECKCKNGKAVEPFGRCNNP